jgi:sulfonate transport system substrate-binding protein
VTWGSYIALARLHDDRTVLARWREGLISGFGYEAASQSAIDDKRPQIEDFLRRLAKARRWAAEHPKEFAAVLAKETGLSPEIALYTVEHYRLTAGPDRRRVRGRGAGRAGSLPRQRGGDLDP